jgi:hypothetical protein
MKRPGGILHSVLAEAGGGSEEEEELERWTGRCERGWVGPTGRRMIGLELM